MNKKEYDNILAFHPGYYINEFIEELELTQEEFAIRLDTTAKTVSKLVNGKANISNDIAKKLSDMLGTSIDLWINLQNEYDKKVIEIQEKEALNKQLQILKKIDYHFFENLKLCECTNDKTKQLKNLLAFLNVSNLSVLENPKILVQYRQVKPLELNELEDRIITNIWVQTIINLGKQKQTSKYDKNKLLAIIPKLRELTLLEDFDFIDNIADMLAQCGVALVFTPSLKGSKVYAAVSWINKDKAVLGITNTGQDADKFWFSLFHEIKHILQNKKKRIILDTQKNIDLEKEANDFAANILIPDNKYKEFKDFIKLGGITSQGIQKFANEIQTHPGIIVGRLQKDNLISYSSYNNLKCKYKMQI